MLVGLVACSSIKEPVQPLQKQDADTMLNSGLDMESRGYYDTARGYFQSAQTMYEGIAEVDGVLACLSGNCRLALRSKDDKAYAEHKEYMQEIIDEIAPEYAYHMLLLSIFELQQNKDYTTIVEIATYKPDDPLTAKLQIATVKLQALAYLRPGTAKEAKELESLAKSYRKQLRKKGSGDAELLSSAWYAIAYYHFTRGAYPEALLFTDKVIELDYRYANQDALGHGYWLKGQVEAKRNYKDEALACLRKAELIFRAGNDDTALQGVAEEIYRLKGDTP